METFRSEPVVRVIEVPFDQKGLTHINRLRHVVKREKSEEVVLASLSLAVDFAPTSTVLKEERVKAERARRLVAELRAIGERGQDEDHGSIFDEFKPTTYAKNTRFARESLGRGALVCVVTCRVDEQDYESLRAIAGACGVDVTDLVRGRIKQLILDASKDSGISV